ncbi:MAG: hypothetical protein RXR44_06135 [Vulcanisaeta sp.]
MIPYTYCKRSSTTGNQLLDTSTTTQATKPPPHPTIILTTRLIRCHEDPTIALLKASNDYDVPRNIAYLHAIHRLIVIDKLKRLLWIKHKTATPAMHAILMKSNHNHNKHLIMQHVPRKVIEKLPRVVLT